MSSHIRDTEVLGSSGRGVEKCGECAFTIANFAMRMDDPARLIWT